MLDDPDNTLHFSPISLWEIVIKSGLGRADFSIDAAMLKRGLLENDYAELPIISRHVLAVTGLPSIHKDPFDRLLIAQAASEGITLLTADAALAEYGAPAVRV